MRLGTRGSPSWPGFGPETGYLDADCSDHSAESTCRRGGPYVCAVARGPSAAVQRGRPASYPGRGGQARCRQSPTPSIESPIPPACWRLRVGVFHPIRLGRSSPDEVFATYSFFGSTNGRCVWAQARDVGPPCHLNRGWAAIVPNESPAPAAERTNLFGLTALLLFSQYGQPQGACGAPAARRSKFRC
jgi:hypothetical protein